MVAGCQVKDLEEEAGYLDMPIKENTVNFCLCWDLLQIDPDLAGHCGHHLGEGRAREEETGNYQPCPLTMITSSVMSVRR